MGLKHPFQVNHWFDISLDPTETHAQIKMARKVLDQTFSQ